MARAPFQVLVLPFRTIVQGQWEFAAFQRSDDQVWQGIAGGGEAGETPAQAALREAMEEAGLPATVPFYCLDSISSIPVCHFPARREWPADLLVIPEHAFAADCSGIVLHLSDEHTRQVWEPYEGILARLRWDSNKTALWELRERLRGNRLAASR